MIALMKKIILFFYFSIYENKIKDWVKAEKWEQKRKLFKFIGVNSNIEFPNRILNPKYISIGDNFNAWYNLRLEAIDEYYSQKFDPKIIIGDNVTIHTDCHIGCINKIEIHNNVLIASRVYITDHFHGKIEKVDLENTPSLRPLSEKGIVVIEENVWIGEGVCILPGVTIGKNSIIGANAVVTKSFEENSVIAGIPAKLIRKLIQVTNAPSLSHNSQL